MAAVPNSATAPAFHPFVITCKAADFPADRAVRLAMLAAFVEKTGGRANG